MDRNHLSGVTLQQSALRLSLMTVLLKENKYPEISLKCVWGWGDRGKGKYSFSHYVLDAFCR